MITWTAIPPEKIPENRKLEASAVRRGSVVLGSGVGGQVFEGSWKVGDSGECVEVVMKLVSNPLEIAKEASVMCNVPAHPNVVQFVGLATVDAIPYIVLERCRNDLRTLLDEGVEISQSFRRKALMEVARGLEHIHKYGIVHRDIAARNILIGFDGTAKLSDFGLARVMLGGLGEYYKMIGRGFLPCRWMAPEALREPFPATENSDVWAFAHTVWEVLTGLLPYHYVPTEEIQTAILHGDVALNLTGTDALLVQRVGETP